MHTAYKLCIRVPMSEEEATKPKGLPLVIPRDLHRLLKVRAAKESKSIRELVVPTLEALVKSEREAAPV